MEPRGRRARRGQWSAWTASGALHVALLVLLGLIMAPLGAFDGPTLLTELTFETSDESPPLELIALAAVGELDESAVEAEAGLPDLLQSLAYEPSADGGTATDTSHALGTGRAARHAAPGAQTAGTLPPGAGAEFFGTVAYGDRFVFILDNSTSMSYGGANAQTGDRFARASTELLYSIERLTDQQSFYVILFNGQTRRMFDDASLVADPLPATRENKDRLRAWLAGVPLGPSTDPRDALRLGLTVRPSAVFLLSDGEFNENNTGLITDKLAVQEVVEQFNDGRAPIHTIAFEDPVNRGTLAGLSAQSGGQHLFVPPLDANGLPVSEEELARLAGDQRLATRPKPPLRKRPKKPLLQANYTAHLVGGGRRAVVEYREEDDAYWLKLPSGGQVRYAKTEVERIDPLP